jgi:sigma-B regulation protein RsbU (phosphoserine phosphatase)
VVRDAGGVVAAMLRGQIADIVVGSLFLFIGLIAGSIAVIRRRRGVRIFAWLGIWSAMYGAMQLTRSPAVMTAAPRWIQVGEPYANAAMAYLIVIAAALAFLEISLGALRLFIRAVATVAFAIAVVGIIVFISSGSTETVMPYNNLLATGALLVLAVVAASRKLSAKFLTLRNSRILAAGTFAFAIEGLYSNVARPFAVDPPAILNHVGFAILLFSFAYVALELVLTNERRLLAVESELAVARNIQLAILPSSVPIVQHLRVSASYRPMTAVAGDFYDFVPVDEWRTGILVADATGHGVPAALIASMIKIAIQSVAACAHDPGAFLSALNRVLSQRSGAQLVSAAYLWVDTSERVARYAAAGHPPLLRWHEGNLERIESNGFLIGMIPECQYPVVTMKIAAGDRFLLYTDGVVDVENSRGDFFGDVRLGEVVRANCSRPPREFSDELLAAADRWRGAAVPQQDDMTLVVVDATDVG